MARNLKILVACLLLSASAHGQVLLSKFGPVTGVLKGAAGQPATSAAGITDLQSILSTTPGLVLAGATGGTQGAGTINATGLFINGSAVGVGGGAVSSIGLTAPTCFGVTGSPVTSAGSIGLTLTGSSANVVHADGTCSALLANPTGTVGLSAVNGTATTAMRSDGAPALSQTITPTWTGLHSWSVSSGQDMVLNSTNANGSYITFARSGTPIADFGNAPNVISGGTLDGIAISPRGASSPIYLATNSGATNYATFTPTSIVFGTTSTNPTFDFHSTSAGTVEGPWTFSFTRGIIGAAPGGSILDLKDTTAATDAKLWEISSASGTFTIQATNDAISAAKNALTISRSGDVVTSLGFGNATDNPGYSFLGTGNAAFGGLVESVQNGSSLSHGFTTVNVSTGTAAAMYNDLQNSATNYIQELTGVNYSGTILTNGPSGQQAALYTNTAVPVVIGTNAAARIAVGGAGNVTVSAPTSGIALSVAGLNNANAFQVVGSTTSGQSFGMDSVAGTTSADYNTLWQSAAGATLGRIYGDGGLTLGTPTGGDLGVGTVNASVGLYVNGVAAGGGSPILVGIKPTNSAATSSTLTPDSSFNITLASGHSYSITGLLVYSCTSSVGGFSYDMTFSGTKASAGSWFTTSVGAGSVGQNTGAAPIPSGGPNTGGVCDTGGLFDRMVLTGFISVATGGTLGISWANAGATGTTTLQAGSYLQTTQLN